MVITQVAVKWGGWKGRGSRLTDRHIKNTTQHSLEQPDRDAAATTKATRAANDNDFLVLAAVVLFKSFAYSAGPDSVRAGCVLRSL